MNTAHMKEILKKNGLLKCSNDIYFRTFLRAASEASGNSYTGCERVSVATGLPTVAGWYVHEWLWRNQLDDLNTRVADVRAIYTSNDEETVKKLIEKYQISYIYIGQTERDTYGTVNDSLLQKIGKVAFSDGTSTYIMKVDSLWNGK